MPHGAVCVSSSVGKTHQGVRCDVYQGVRGEAH